MEEYYIDKKGLYDVLNEKGINSFFHANTVTTSITFIKNRALLSRAYVESNKLKQTPQKSDNEDKKYNVWDDVFLDALDLHKKYKRANYYGPILFIMKLELLLSPSVKNVLVAKTNPMYWKSYHTMNDKYYSNLEDIKNDYLSGRRLDSQIMFTFRNPEQSLKLNKFLKGVLVDKPSFLVKFRKKSGETVESDLGNTIFSNIKIKMSENGLGHIPVHFRHEKNKFHFCRCSLDYTQLFNFNFQELKKRFTAN